MHPPPPLLAAALALAALLSLPGCAGAGRAGPPPAGTDEATARATLRRFAEDLEAGRYAAALPLLAARWREGATPGRLSQDHRGAGPVAREAAQRVLARLAEGVPLAVQGGRAVLPVGPDRAAVLLVEGGAWRVDALE